MRGRTLSDAVVILDEAQNTSPAQIRMFLTRMGWNTKMIITGDMTQVDLPRGVKSGLRDAIDTLKDISDIAIIHFNDKDIVRHRLVTKIVNAFKAKEDETKNQNT
jgi:phosphate starvation-inducible PhoH-like protein